MFVMQKTKERFILKMQMKRIFFRLIVIFVVFFVVGFIMNWKKTTEEYYKCINKEFSTVEDSNGQDFNEWWLEIHDNFSTTYKTELSFHGGLLFGALGTAVSSYIYLLYKLFSSKNMKKVITGLTLIIITLICLFLIYIFIANFNLVF